MTFAALDIQTAHLLKDLIYHFSLPYITF